MPLTLEATQAIRQLSDLVHEELIRAYEKHPPMHSAHEGYAVILEEVDELWDEVKKQTGARNRVRMAEEAIQIAAMAIRFVIDVVREDK